MIQIRKSRLSQGSTVVCVHVATYRGGDTEPGYHSEAKHETHKATILGAYSEEMLIDEQVSLDPYRKESLKILKIFGEMCPTIRAFLLVSRLPVSNDVKKMYRKSLDR